MIWVYIFYLLLVLSIAGLSVTIHVWLKRRWVKKVEEALPEVLETMVSMLNKGYSIEYALSELYRIGPDPIRPYLKGVLRKAKQGISLSQALIMSLKELKHSPFISLAVNIIAKGLEHGSPIASLLDTIGSYQRKIILLEREKRRRIWEAAGINLILTPIMLGALSTVLKSMAGEGPLVGLFVDMFKLYSIVAGSVAMLLIYFLSKKARSILILIPLGAFLGFAPVYFILEVLK